MAFEGIIQEMADQLIEDFDAERCTIRGLHRNKLKLIAARGINTETRRDEIEIAGTIAGNALTSRTIQNITDITKDKRYDPTYIVHNGAKALMAIPLLFEGEFLCVAQIYRKEPFSKKDENFAKTLARYMASTLRHIEISKMNRQTILDLIEASFRGNSFKEIFMNIAEKTSLRLEVPSCLIYQVFSRGNEYWCKIVAGVPPGEHEIDYSQPLKQQPHIESTFIKKQLITFDRLLSGDQLDNLVSHLSGIILRKKINSILCAPVDTEGVIVLEAIGEKESFSAEEKSFCFDVGRITAHLFERDRTRAREIEDVIINPTESMAGYAARSLESILQICDNTDRICKNQQDKCDAAKSMCENAVKLLPSTVKITTEGKRVVSSIIKFKNTHLI